MKIDKAEKRDKKNFKSRNGMRVSNKSIFTIQRAQAKRDAETLKKSGAK